MAAGSTQGWGAAPELLPVVSGRVSATCRILQGGPWPLAFDCRLCLAACLMGLSPGQWPAKQLVASEPGERTGWENKRDESLSSVALRQELDMPPRLALCSSG